MYPVLSANSYPEFKRIFDYIEIDDAVVIDVPWGTISKSEKLNTYLLPLVSSLNNAFKASLLMSDFSIALGEMREGANHGKWINTLPVESLKRDDEGREMPRRIYIPIDCDMVFRIGEDEVLAHPGDLVALPNFYVFDFIEARTETQTGRRFLIIDTPPFENREDWEHPVV